VASEQHAAGEFKFGFLSINSNHFEAEVRLNILKIQFLLQKTK
jgi:hypothetical protein